MTVKELEEALGMTRANIRFYEREGLLSPTRLENGYRDYNQEDLETLEKIKLLRRLQFDLEDIRAFQAGTLDLTAALGAQAEKLRAREADLAAARSLCRRMAEEQVGYGELEAKKYLDDMARLEREGTRFQSVAADSLPTVNRPWVRWFARGLDMGLWGLVVVWALHILLGIRPSDHWMAQLLENYLAWGVAFLAEPLLLSTWGTTPGKWLLGLRVRNTDGGKLSFGQAAARLAVLFQKGEGWGLPIYNLYRNYKSYQACAAGEVLPWDEGLSYTLDGPRPIGVAGYVVSRAAVAALAVLVGVACVFPPAGAPLTVADFARNYNFLLQRVDSDWDSRLDENGRWTDQWGGEPDRTPPELEFFLEDGQVTGVAIEYDGEPGYFGVDRANHAVMLLALLRAQPGSNLLTWWSRVRNVPVDLFQSEAPVTYAGLTVSRQVETTGYRDFGGYYIPEPDQIQEYWERVEIRVAPEE